MADVAKTGGKMKQAGQTVLKFGAGAAGLSLGAFGLKKVGGLLPDSVPAIGKKVVPGLVVMLVSYFAAVKFDNDKIKSVLFGLGLSGFADIVLKLLGDKVSFIQANVPALSGIPQYRAFNSGGVGYDYFLYNSLQGLKGLGSPYALNGDAMSMQGTSMQGTSMQGPYSLNGQGGNMSAMNSYALN